MLQDKPKIPAGDRLLSLQLLGGSPGWALYCARRVALLQQVETEIFDRKTSPERTELLKNVRASLVEEHTPERVLSSLITATENEAKRESRAS